MPPRELSGVIACLQEIELALLELKGDPSAQRGADLDEVTQAVRAFFKNPCRDEAEKIDALIRRKAAAGSAAVRELFRKSLTIDGHPATLAGLGLELFEVLEDLG